MLAGNQNLGGFLRQRRYESFLDGYGPRYGPACAGRSKTKGRPVTPEQLARLPRRQKKTGQEVKEMQLPRSLRKFLGNLILITFVSALPCASFSQVAVGVSITVAPPELPVYEQPFCPGPNYMWTPGYWAWDGVGGYYWVPGTWVVAPAVGLLWTPGYWGWNNGGYLWNAGYWGPQVGFYGGVNYGYGYSGVGFYGGRWNGRYFNYNTAVMRVNTTVIRNTYVDRTVVRNVTVNRVSYNGGRGGIEMRPTAAQEAAAREKRFGARPAQLQQERIARQDKANFVSENHGRPAYAATAKPVASVTELHRAVPANGGRPLTANQTRPATNERPAARPTNETRPALKPQPTHTTAETRPTPKPGTRPTPEATPAHETRPTSTRPYTITRPANETRPAVKPQPTHTTAETRPAPRPTPTVKPAPAKPAMETQQASRPATPPRPAPAVRPETRPAPVQQARPEPQPRPETRPAPVQQARPESQPRPESRPEPQPRPAQSAERPAPKPAPEPRPSQSAARPAPQQHESAPRPSAEKPHPGGK